jgi:hypothetical protein
MQFGAFQGTKGEIQLNVKKSVTKGFHRSSGACRPKLWPDGPSRVAGRPHFGANRPQDLVATLLRRHQRRMQGRRGGASILHGQPAKWWLPGRPSPLYCVFQGCGTDPWTLYKPPITAICNTHTHTT